MKRFAPILLLLLLTSSPLMARWGSCFTFDPCGSGPLCCGGLNLTLQGGGSPSSYTHRGQVLFTLPGRAPAAVVLLGPQITRFSDQFNVPWSIGAEFGWNASKRSQYFIEYRYTRAEGENYRYRLLVNGSALAFSETFDPYEVQAGYLGSRYYLEGFCLPCVGQMAPYVGFKAGVAVQTQVCYRLSLDGMDVAGAPYFRSLTAVSAGVQLGLEWWFCAYFSAVLQGEFVGTQGSRPNRDIALNPTVRGITNVSIGSTGWIVAWPITLALRYNF